MRRAVLVDTGPLYAAVDRSDQYHTRAQKELDTLATQQYAVLLAYPTLLEAYTLVLRRLGRQTAQRWLEELSKRHRPHQPDAGRLSRSRRAS